MLMKYMHQSNLVYLIYSPLFQNELHPKSWTQNFRSAVSLCNIHLKKSSIL